MGCDIHSYAEKRTESGWQAIEKLHPFDWRSYGMFGFLADVRNYSAVPPIAEKRGFPDDASPCVVEEYESWSGDAHSVSWLSVDELASFDYDQMMEDRRYMGKVAENAWSGALTADEGQGKKMSFREFLGEGFFDDLKELKEAGAERIVFWFDN